MTSEVKSEMNLRDQLLRKARRTNREIDWSSYKRQRNKVNSQVKKCKSNYYKDLLQDKASSPDKNWSAIKKLYPTKITTGSAAAININGTKTSNTSSIAQGFCDFFSTIAGVLKTKSFPLRNFVWGKPVNSCETTSPDHFVFSSVSDDEVFRELRNLKRNKSNGLDNLPPGMLKDAATIITKPLAYIINLSLQSGSLPMEWKAAKIIPLFKSGSMVELDNYRPISILPVLSKILERIVYKQLLSHLENNGLLSSFQFGFRSKRSTELAVTYFTDKNQERN